MCVVDVVKAAKSASEAIATGKDTSGRDGRGGSYVFLTSSQVMAGNAVTKVMGGTNQHI